MRTQTHIWVTFFTFSSVLAFTQSISNQSPHIRALMYSYFALESPSWLCWVCYSINLYTDLACICVSSFLIHINSLPKRSKYVHLAYECKIHDPTRPHEILVAVELWRTWTVPLGVFRDIGPAAAKKIRWFSTRRRSAISTKTPCSVRKSNTRCVKSRFCA